MGKQAKKILRKGVSGLTRKNMSIAGKQTLGRKIRLQAPCNNELEALVTCREAYPDTRYMCKGFILTLEECMKEKYVHDSYD